MRNDDLDDSQLLGQSLVVDSGYETTKTKGTRLNPNFIKKLHHHQLQINNREMYQNLGFDGESAESEMILQRGQAKNVLRQ